MAVTPYTYFSLTSANITNPYAINVYNGSSTISTTLYEDAGSASNQEYFASVYESMQKMFKTTTLSSLFDGNLGQPTTYAYESTTLSTVVNANDYVIEFDYNEDRQTLQKNGKDYYYNTTSSAYVDGLITFTSLWFAINTNDDGAIGDLSIYIRKTLSNNANSNYSIIKISTIANQNSLIEVLDDLMETLA